MPFKLEEERLRGIFESVSDGIVVVDRYLRVIGINPAAEVMINRKKEEVVQKLMLGEILSCTDSDGAGLEEISVSVSDSLQGKSETSRELEITIFEKNGKRLSVPGLFVLAPCSTDADPYGFILMRDIQKRVLESELIERERIDPLSGLYARAFFDELYEKEVRRAVRHGGRLGVLIIELQNLEKIVDPAKNPLSESLIRQVGQLIKNATREVDAAARYKNNEFIVLLLDSDLSRAALVGQRIRGRLKALSSEAALSPPLKFRLGAAVAEKEYELLLKRAKEALK
jgi:diguanylate cyclase (GGDEF)-like protein/PAS domain S-box-containing protein